jgi:hypothetical protein
MVHGNLAWFPPRAQHRGAFRPVARSAARAGRRANRAADGIDD